MLQRATIALSFLILVGGCSTDQPTQGPVTEVILSPSDTPSAPDVPGPVDTGPAPTDVVASDTAPVDITPPGEFGAPCNNNEDCDSGWCVEGQNGYICTKACAETCPPGYDCKSVSSGGSDIVFLCVPQVQKLCVPCAKDFQCTGGVCLTLDGEGQCGYACGDDTDCPSGFSCASAPDDTHQGTFCQPTSGSCSCIPSLEGNQRTCTRENEHGACFGVESCDLDAGWTGCTAIEPSAEICDGIDNNCNGLVDEGLAADEACENTVEGVGSCTGVKVCLGPQGWVCQGQTPEVEACDYKDNNCDGAVDEPFVQDGVYTHFDHCGSCNLSCAIGFPNALATSCTVLNAEPQCIVETCEPGYVKANEFQCIPNVASICQPCTSDANCLGVDASCVQLDEGGFCGQACAAPDDCPEGYSCQDAGVAMTQCVPTSGSCSCDGTNTELSRACSATYTPPDPTQPSYTCNGFEYCTEQGWSPCELPTEECDGVDNDCNGQVDEGYKNPVTGKYDTVAHCGGCNISCLALAYPNALAGCDGGGDIPQCTFLCEAGWTDVNGLTDDGCECQYIADEDLAGDGVDANCDGVDGEIAQGIFVAKDGSDDNPGTREAPMLTLNAAIMAADAGAKRDVYVATGVYSENIVLYDGIGVFGGYSSDFAKRNTLTFETAIIGTDPTPTLPAAVTATSLGGPNASGPTIFDGFTVFGSNAANFPGANSYAVYLVNCGENLIVRNNRIFAGAGGNGASGGAGTDGNDGFSGAKGKKAYDVPWFGGNRTCFEADELDGGDGGQNICPDGASISGGEGGYAHCPVYGAFPSGGQHGALGDGPGGGAGGNAGWDGRVQTNNNCSLCNMPSNQNPMSAGLGATGGPGMWGASGAGCSQNAGKVLANHWQAYNGTVGATAGHGGGGGGGGAGGGVQVSGTGCASDGGHDVGGSGGGGGSGGCAGTGGVSGSGGGGSFAIFVVYSLPPLGLPQLIDNQIRAGAGGIGGQGGPGGAGGVGGYGAGGGGSGEGALNTFCARGGASGGDGGQGGHGGGGGGGCGGSSYGVFLWQAGAGLPTGDLKASNTFLAGGQGGAGGAGGASLGNSGGAGATGAKADTNF